MAKTIARNPRFAITPGNLARALVKYHRMSADLSADLKRIAAQYPAGRSPTPQVAALLTRVRQAEAHLRAAAAMGDAVTEMAELVNVRKTAARTLARAPLVTD